MELRGFAAPAAAHLARLPSTMKPQTLGLIGGIALTVPACFIAFVSVGAGHGNYFAFKLVFPITMLSALLGGITLPFIIVGLAQFPVYGFLVGRHWNAPERKNVT